MDANEALRQLGEATREVNREALQHLERGAHPDAVALGLLRISDGLPEDVIVAQLGAQTAKLPDESRAAVAERVVDGLTGEHKVTFLTQLVDGMTDEEFARFAQSVTEERQQRRAGGPPATTGSNAPQNPS